MAEICIRRSYQTIQSCALYTALLQIIEATRAKAHGARNRSGLGGGGGGTRVTSKRGLGALITPTAAGKMAAVVGVIIGLSASYKVRCILQK